MRRVRVFETFAYCDTWHSYRTNLTYIRTYVHQFVCPENANVQEHCPQTCVKPRLVRSELSDTYVRTSSCPSTRPITRINKCEFVNCPYAGSVPYAPTKMGYYYLKTQRVRLILQYAFTRMWLPIHKLMIKTDMILTMPKVNENFAKF